MTGFEIVYLTVQLLALISWIALPIGLWKLKSKPHRTKFLILVLIINAILGVLNWVDQRAIPTPSVTTAAGDFWDIETVFQADPNVTSRAWKRSILNELITNLNNYRQANGFGVVPLNTVESFSPQQLQRLLEQDPASVQLLDVREAYEREGYGLAGSAAYRYGDLANNLKPNLDPDKKVVVICYSGIRGYLVANVLQQLGFEQAGFIRGGLEAWNDAKLPAVGDYDDFEFLAQKYERFDEARVAQNPNSKIDFRADAPSSSFSFSNTQTFNGELATTQSVNDFMESLNQAPVLLLCESESECYDARMFAYNYENIGGTIIGYYDFK